MTEEKTSKKNFINQFAKKNEGGFSGKFKSTSNKESLKKAPILSSSSNKTNKVKKKNDNLGYAEYIDKSRNNTVFLVRGRDCTRECSMCKEYSDDDCSSRGNECERFAWHYIKVDFKKKDMFLSKSRGGSINVTDYGVILKSGWGRNPPKSVVQEIEKEYN